MKRFSKTIIAYFAISITSVFILNGCSSYKEKKALEAIKDGTKEQKLRAVEQLGKLDESQEGVKALLKILKDMIINSEWDSELLYKVINSLNKLGHTTEAIDPLLIVLKEFPSSWDTNDRIQRGSITYLKDVYKSGTKDQRIVDVLVNIVNSRCSPSMCDPLISHALYSLEEIEKGKGKMLFRKLKKRVPEYRLKAADCSFMYYNWR